jgi:uncharacterized protein YfiM (DUF2279 family)
LKKLLFIILLLISYRAEAQQILPQDKLLHLGGSYVIGAATTSIVYHYTQNKRTSKIAGIAAVILIGTSKEIWDVKNGDPDIGDFTANLIGGSLGVVTITINF